MRKLRKIHVCKPLVMEAGERSAISAAGIDTEGKLVMLNGSDYRIESERTDVAAVDGVTLYAAAPGDSLIRAVVESDGQRIERSWLLRVIPRKESRFSDIVPSRPRILFTSDEQNEFRNKISGSARLQSADASVDFPGLWKSLLEKADHFVAEENFQVKYPSASNIMDVVLPLREPDPVPDPPGYVDYPFWTMFSRAVEERLQVLSAAYLVTDKPEYAGKIREYLLGLSGFSKWYEFDHNGAVGNLSNAHLLIGASIAYDAVRAALQEEERRQAAEAILCRGLQPLAVDFGNEDMHNIIVAKQVAMMFGAAALYGETPYCGKYMNQAFEYLMSYLDRRLHSGETEGLMYDNVAARHILMAADLFRRVTGDSSLCDHPYLRELPERYFRFLSTGGTNSFPNISDSFYKLDLSYLMSMTASHHSHPVAMWYISRFEANQSAVLMNLRRVPDSRSPDEYYGPDKSKAFPSIGWASLRSGWKDNDHLLCFTSSPSARDHTHKDQNNIMLSVAGEWLLTNPGYQDYVPGPRADYTVGTIGHNSLLIEGLGQRLRGGGKLAGAWMNSGFEAVQGDASESYDGLLNSFVRTVFHIDETYYLLWDEVRTQEERTAEMLFHTVSQILSGDKKLAAGEEAGGKEVVIQGEKASLQLMWVLPKEPTVTVCEVPGAESYGPHLSIKSDKSRRHRFVTVLCPQTAGERVEVHERTELAEGGVVIIAERHNGIRDTFVLCGADGQGEAAAYDGIAIEGEAAWFTSGTLEDDEDIPSRWILWKGVEIAATGTKQFRLRASRPVNAMFTRQGEVETLSVQTEDTVELQWSGADGRRSEWKLGPGIHRLALALEGLSP